MEWWSYSNRFKWMTNVCGSSLMHVRLSAVTGRPTCSQKYAFSPSMRSPWWAGEQRDEG